MKTFESDDELDRALFALDLEEPPAELRRRILARTVYRMPVPVKPWEVWTLGVIAALAVWLIVLVLQGAPGFDRASASVAEGFATFTRPDVLFWTALGASVTFWISQLNLTAVPGASRTGRR